jgi:hypothetical protein
MKAITILAIIAILTGAAVVPTIGSTTVTTVAAQMADNATMGNMTGGNMTMGEMNQTGSVSFRDRP